MQLHPRNVRAQPARAPVADGNGDALRTTADCAALHAAPPRVSLVSRLRGYAARYVAAAPLTALFAAANLIIYTGVAVGGPRAIEALWEIGAVRWDRPFEFWRLFTFAWIHLDFTHVIVNVIMLLIAGRLLEPTVGSRTFAKVYLFATVISALASVFNWDSMTAGASGAVYGLIGALLAVPVCVRLSRAIAVWGIVACYVGLDMSGEHSESIAVATHIGGLITGAIAGAFAGLGAHPDAAPAHEAPR